MRKRGKRGGWLMLDFRMVDLRIEIGITKVYGFVSLQDFLSQAFLPWPYITLFFTLYRLIYASGPTGIRERYGHGTGVIRSYYRMDTELPATYRQAAGKVQATWRQGRVKVCQDAIAFKKIVIWIGTLSVLLHLSPALFKYVVIPSLANRTYALLYEWQVSYIYYILI